ncbi:hypothetical protein BGP_3931 [Beggiatoa sp. PS]|nr:hypothetical protein BGP_3931 [Beggiatoa sp. PS]
MLSKHCERYFINSHYNRLLFFDEKEVLPPFKNVKQAVVSLFRTIK